MGFLGSAKVCRQAVFAGVLAAAGACAWGQATPAAPETKMTVVEPPIPLLPQTIGDLSAQAVTRIDEKTIGTLLSTPESFDAATCLPVMPGAGAAAPRVASQSAAGCPAVLKEDGLQRMAAGRFLRQGAGGGLELSVYEFGDATGAYSAYTFLRARMAHGHLSASDARAMKAAAETTTDPDGVLIWAGTVLARVKGQATPAEISALTMGLPKVSGRRGIAPLLPTLLPKGGLDQDNVRYALGPVGYGTMNGVLPAGMLSWEKSAEAATAEYSGKPGRGTLTLLLYPTPQIAGDRGRAIEKEVNDEGGKQKFGTVVIRRVGPLLGMTSGGWTEEQAKALLGGLHLNEELSYDKPMPLEFHAEVAKTASLLQNIAVLCGVLILAAVLLGLFLGGARAGIRILQGKPAASEPEFLTISLRDEPKALFAGQDGKRRE